MGLTQSENLKDKVQEWASVRAQENWEPIGNIFAIFFLGVFFYVLNHFWSYLGVLNQNFAAVLWLLNLSIVISMAFNLLRLLFDSQRFRHFLQTLQNTISAVVFYVIYNIFPFSVSSQIEVVIRVFLVFIIIVVSIGALAEFVQTINPKNK